MLGALKNQSLEELKICSNIGSDCDVDSWVKFGIQKRVQTLELDFSYPVLWNVDNAYNFPSLL